MKILYTTKVNIDRIFEPVESVEDYIGEFEEDEDFDSSIIDEEDDDGRIIKKFGYFTGDDGIIIQLEEGEGLYRLKNGGTNFFIKTKEGLRHMYSNEGQYDLKEDDPKDIYFLSRDQYELAKEFKNAMKQHTVKVYYIPEY